MVKKTNKRYALIPLIIGVLCYSILCIGEVIVVKDIREVYCVKSCDEYTCFYDQNKQKIEVEYENITCSSGSVRFWNFTYWRLPFDITGNDHENCVAECSKYKDCHC